MPVVSGLSPQRFLPWGQRDPKGQEPPTVEPWVEDGSLWEEFGASEQPGRKQQGRWTPSALLSAGDPAWTAVVGAHPWECACSLLQGLVMEKHPGPSPGLAQPSGLGRLVEVTSGFHFAVSTFGEPQVSKALVSLV